MTCISKCRIIMAIFNILANIIGLLFGTVIIVCGILGIVVFRQFLLDRSTINTTVLTGFGLVIFVGIFLIIISIAALLGSSIAICPCNKNCKTVGIIMLFVSILGLSIIFIVEIAATVLGFLYIEVATEAFNGAYVELLNSSFTSNPTEANNIYGELQTYFFCCGASGHEDYAQITGFMNNEAIPNSCCIPPGTLCYANSTTTAVVPEGCAIKLIVLFTQYYKIVIGFGIALLVILALSIFFKIMTICALAATDTSGAEGSKFV